jgi:ABC-type lipoprotein release transport system permease subunit
MNWVMIKLAWRNLFRNKRRTFIAGTAIGLGLASLIFVDGLLIGMKDSMIQTATTSFLGEGQIHSQGFRKTQEVELTVNDLPEVQRKLRTDPLVLRFTPRILSFGMISSAANMSAVSVVGVQPETEQPLSLIDEALVEGSFFKGHNPQDILIGKKLAEILEVGLNDRVVVTVTQARTGDLSQEMFRVSGIFHFNVKEMDQNMLFIRLSKAQQMLALPGQVHEIALKLARIRLGQDSSHPIWAKYSENGNEALGWASLLPELNYALKLTDFTIYIMAIMLVGIVALSIINTLFMSLHERMFEFGVMRAVGTRRGGVIRLIIFESGALAFLSIILGSILGFLLLLISSRVGIDYSGIEFVGVTLQKAIYPVFRVSQFVRYPLWIFFFTLVIGIYPALYAAKIAPAAAMRKSL